MKFIHTADLHIGAKPDADRAWGPAREDAVRHALERMADICDQEGIDLLLIAGDLFHFPPTEAMLKETDTWFARMPRTRVVITAGNHDYLRPGCAFSRHAFPSNVTLLAQPCLQTVSFPELGVDVSGFSYDCEILRENPAEGVQPPRSGLRHILMLHGGDREHAPVNFAAMQNAGWDYIAMGHIHKPSLNEAGKAAMPGTPEPLNRNETGEHGFYQGEMDARGLTLAWRRFSRFLYTDLNINITPDATQSGLEALLRKRLQTDGSEVCRIILSGRRDPALVFDRDALLRLGPVSDVIDRTLPDYDWDAFAERPEQDILRRTIRALAPDETDEAADGGTDGEAPLRQKALYYALDALLASESKRQEVLR
ncbi:MAG: DNA repair exonuclease [Lachnospiraceae bacterium]|nr:DNA repair exonuclease [Lachnospiraceae bacterium]